MAAVGGGGAGGAGSQGSGSGSGSGVEAKDVKKEAIKKPPIETASWCYRGKYIAQRITSGSLKWGYAMCFRNSKTQIVLKLKNPNCDENQKLKGTH